MSDSEYPNECRHCNSSKTKVDQIWISNQIGYHYYVVCEECLMRGPMKVSPSSATKDWNNLPRLPRRNESIDQQLTKLDVIETVVLKIEGHIMAVREEMYHIDKNYRWRKGPPPPDGEE